MTKLTVKQIDERIKQLEKRLALLEECVKSMCACLDDVLLRRGER